MVQKSGVEVGSVSPLFARLYIYIYTYTSRVGVCDFFQSAIYVRRSYHVNFEGHVLQVGSLGAMMGTSKGSVKQVCETGGVEG